MGWRRGERQCPGHYENAPPPRPAMSSRPHPFHSHFSRELQKVRPWQKQLCYQILEESRNFLSQKRPWGTVALPSFYRHGH